MTGRTKIGILALALLMLPGYAPAQDVAESLDELLRSGALRPGDDVYVTDAAGQRIQGRISDVSSSILAITAGRKIWTLADGDIRRIELQDRVDTSIWLGIGIAAAGAGVLWAVERANGGIFLSALGAGAGLGWFLDASTHKTIYRKSGAARLSVSPVVSTERVGAQMSVGW